MRDCVAVGQSGSDEDIALSFVRQRHLRRIESFKLQVVREDLGLDSTLLPSFFLEHFKLLLPPYFFNQRS